MRITVVVENGFVAVDGRGFSNLELPSLGQTIRAVQWFGTYGDIEHHDPVTKNIVRNERFEDASLLDGCVAVWQRACEDEAALEEQRRIEEEAALAQMPTTPSQTT